MSISPKRFASIGLLLFGGCVSSGQTSNLIHPADQVATVTARITQAENRALNLATRSQPSSTESVVGQPTATGARNRAVVQPVGFAREAAALKTDELKRVSSTTPKTLMIDGVTYSLKPVREEAASPNGQLVHTAGFRKSEPSNSWQNQVHAETQHAAEIDSATAAIEGPYELPVSAAIDQPVLLNLPSVLAAIDGQHPIVGQARWHVQRAYARNDQANALWLPSIQTGFSFHRHDGNYQASNGDIVDVNRNSFQYGLGAGATGAGTTNPRPGIVAQFHLADAIFLPRVTKKVAWAEGHSANATLNEQLLVAAQAYFSLVDAHQDLRIVEEARKRISDVAAITVDFAEAGEGLQADADRLRTELVLIESRLIGAEESVAIAAAQLAQAISLDGNGTIVPTDVNAVPLDLTAPETGQASLVATALQTRPELKESQALVAAACEAYQREKYAPFVPSVLLGFSTGGFGGGLGNNLDNIDSRYDFDALLTWEVRNLGFGEKALRREQSARIQAARFEKLRVMDEIARDVRESHSQVSFRGKQIQIAIGAIESAEASYRRNIERIRDGEGLPLEVLQSAQAFESAQRAYLRAVVNYNQAQIQLQWALGFPVSN